VPSFITRAFLLAPHPPGSGTQKKPRRNRVNYLKANPEHFIESNTQNYWNEYLTNVTARFMM